MAEVKTKVEVTESPIRNFHRDIDVQPDRTCHFTQDFEEILEASVGDDLKCIYCTDYLACDVDHLKNHILKVHYTFAYSYILDEQKLCVLPCRRKCIARPRQGNRSHFHCPSCCRTYGRKPALAHHVEVWKGHCIPFGPFMKENKPLRSLSRHRTQPYRKPEKDSPKKELPSLESGTAASFLEELGITNGRIKLSDSPHDSSSYTVVVENEDDDMDTSGMSQIDKGGDDSSGYFGKTVASRIRSFSGKKRAEAMQKIMQVLFEVEYS